MVLIEQQNSLPFHWSHVDLTILKGRDMHLDMNELSIIRHLPLNLNLTTGPQIQAEPST